MIQTKQINKIIGFEWVNDRYFVTSQGNVISVYKNGTQKILKGMSFNSKYLRIDLNGNNQKKSIAIHRLVALAFIPNPENKEQVNHIDGCGTNNHVSNLEFVSNSENVRHSYKLGTRKGIKPILQYDLEDNFINEFCSIREAARCNNINHRRIIEVLLGDRKHAGGFKWKYKESSTTIL